MIISVHVPRTGGTSFLHYLRRHFGTRLLEDYSWSAQPVTPEQIGGYDCVHGHFFARRYRGIDGAKFALWFREPLRRLRSHYAFWRENEYPENDLWTAMRADTWSFEKFALSRHGSVRNLQSQILDFLEIDQLHFVGLTEEYERSLVLFERIFGLPREVPSARIRETKPVHWDALTPQTMNAIRRLHAEDFVVYNQARRRFEELADAHNV